MDQPREAGQARFFGRSDEVGFCFGFITIRLLPVDPCLLDSRVFRIKDRIGEDRDHSRRPPPLTHLMPHRRQHGRRRQTYNFVVDDQRSPLGRRAGRLRDWERPERHVLQYAVAHNRQSLPPQLCDHRPKYHTAQFRRGQLRRTCVLALIALGQESVGAQRNGLDLGAPGQRESAERSRRDGPEKATLFAERIFQQERVSVERLPLNLFELERDGIGQRRVTWALNEHLPLNLLMFGEQRAKFFLYHRRLFYLVPAY